MSVNITSTNTNNISKTTNQYTADVVNIYKINKVLNLKKAYYDFDDVVVYKLNAIYTNENITVNEIIKFVNCNNTTTTTNNNN